MRLPRRPRARNPVVSSPASALTQQARGPVFYKDCCNNEREDFRGEGGLSTMQSTIRIAAPATPSPHPYVTPDSPIGECLLVSARILLVALRGGMNPPTLVLPRCLTNTHWQIHGVVRNVLGMHRPNTLPFEDNPAPESTRYSCTGPPVTTRDVADD